MTFALYPGSFDPVHVGHLTVIEKAASMFDRVVVAVVGNPDKPSGMFSIAERIRLIEAAVAELGNVECISHNGLTVDALPTTGSDVIIRTGHKDAEDEWAMLAMNKLMTGARTFFVPPDPSVAHVSASLVRSLAGDGRLDDAISLVPIGVFETLVRATRKTS